MGPGGILEGMSPFFDSPRQASALFFGGSAGSFAQQPTTPGLGLGGAVNNIARESMFPAGMTPVNPSALHYPGTPMSDMSLFSDLEFQSSTPWNNNNNISSSSNSGAHGSAAPVFDMIFPSMGAGGSGGLAGLGGLTPAAIASSHSGMKRGPFGSSSGGSGIHARSVWMQRRGGRDSDGLFADDECSQQR